MTQNPRYEADENPPPWHSLGFGAQFSLIASATLLVTPVVVAKASGRDNEYLVWMVFASLVVAGLSTLIQVRRIGLVGSRSMLPMFTAAFSIPFCITAVSDGGPATLAALVLVCGIGQLGYCQVAFRFAPNSHTRSGWNGADDPVNHAGVGGAPPAAGRV